MDRNEGQSSLSVSEPELISAFMAFLDGLLGVNKALFLDRDGTLIELVNRENKRLTSVWNLEEVRYVPDAKEVVTKAKNLGYLIFIVTNQPAIVDGNMNVTELAKINEEINKHLNVDDFRMALIQGKHNYKPNPGMLEELIKEYDIDIKNSYMVGDRWKDIQAGYQAGVKTILVGGKIQDKFSYLQKGETFYLIEPDYCVDVLGEILEIIK